MPKCSNCKEEGHTKAKCQNPTVVTPSKVLEVPLVDIHLPEEDRAKFGRIVQMCEEVAYGLGKGHVEAHYQQALCVELQMAGIQHVTEEVMPITYKGRSIGGGCNIERAHLLDDVIDALEADSEHYAKCSVTVRVGEKDELWSRIRAAS